MRTGVNEERVRVASAGFLFPHSGTVISALFPGFGLRFRYVRIAWQPHGDRFWRGGGESVSIAVPVGLVFSWEFLFLLLFCCCLFVVFLFLFFCLIFFICCCLFV